MRISWPRTWPRCCRSHGASFSSRKATSPRCGASRYASSIAPAAPSNPLVPVDSLFVAISQSGETADTLAALRRARQSGYLSSLAICNVPESSLVRESELVMLTRAGPEIGVASTKAFTTQLAALALLVIALARRHGADAERERGLVTRAVELR